MLAVACGIISIACCGAAVNVSAPVAYEGADIAAAAAAAGQDKRDQDLLHWAISKGSDGTLATHKEHRRITCGIGTASDRSAATAMTWSCAVCAQSTPIPTSCRRLRQH